MSEKMNNKCADNVFPDIPKWITLDDQIIPKLAKSIAENSDVWINKNASFFSPISDWSDKKDRYLRRKAFAELSIYLYVADNMGSGETCNDFENLVTEYVNQKEFVALVKRHPKQLLLFGAAVNYVKFKLKLSTETDDAVKGVLERRAVWAVERVPHRILDLWNFLMVYEGSSALLNVNSILDNSCLRFQPDVIDSTLHEAYALTHILLFYYNFGISDKGFPKELLPDDIEEVVIGLVLRYCAENNYDIVLELIYIAAMHQQLPKWLYQFAMSCMDGFVCSNGLVKGPKNPNSDEMEGRGAEYIEWAENYHTTLVAASTFRYIANNWDTVDIRVSNKNVFTSESDFNSIHKAGCALASLAAYELPLGAHRTKLALQDSTVFSQKILRKCQEFIEYQKNSDGTFGFWQDEETLYYRSGGTKQSFYKEIVEPVSKLCELAVENIA